MFQYFQEQTKNHERKWDLLDQPRIVNKYYLHTPRYKTGVTTDLSQCPIVTGVLSTYTHISYLPLKVHDSGSFFFELLPFLTLLPSSASSSSSKAAAEVGSGGSPFSSSFSFKTIHTWYSKWVGKRRYPKKWMKVLISCVSATVAKRIHRGSKIVTFLRIPYVNGPFSRFFCFMRRRDTLDFFTWNVSVSSSVKFTPI